MFQLLPDGPCDIHALLVHGLERHHVAAVETYPGVRPASAPALHSAPLRRPAPPAAGQQQAGAAGLHLARGCLTVSRAHNKSYIRQQHIKADYSTGLGSGALGVTSSSQRYRPIDQ